MPSAQLIVSSDPDEQARNFGLLDQRYEQLSCGAFRGSVSSIDLPSMTLFRESLHQSVHQTGCAPADRITIAAPCEMSDEAYWNGRHIGADAIIAFSPGREFELRSPRRAVCTGVSFDRPAAGNELHTLLRRDTWAAPHAADAERLGQRLAAVLEAVSAEPAMLQERAAAAQLADEVLGLLVAHLSAAAEPDRPLRQGNHPRVAARAS
jgi:AraC family transcriptional regulator, ethanolamine operon transcriptional activator